MNITNKSLYINNVLTALCLTMCKNIFMKCKKEMKVSRIHGLFVLKFFACFFSKSCQTESMNSVDKKVYIKELKEKSRKSYSIFKIREETF